MDGREVLGARIREIRESQLMTIVELARRSGVSYAYLKYIETEGRQPSGIIVHKIADALRVSVNAITCRKPQSRTGRRRTAA